MPLVPEGEDQLSTGISALPQPVEDKESSSVLDVAAAAERTSNLAGTLYDRLNNPKPDAKAVPGFDPLVSVPKGYEPYAEKFLDAHSPEDMAWIRERIDSEEADKRTIQRAGGWGFAASLAAGLTDPLTLASMLIPGGGETRLAMAGRAALINAGTSAAQETAMHQLQVTRTMGESALNVGASALVGGVLGSIASHVPRGELDRVTAATGAEMNKTPDVTATLGIRGSSFDDHMTGPELLKALEDNEKAHLANPQHADVNSGGMPELHPVPEESTAGAAAAKKTDIEGESFARGAKTIAEGPIGGISPSGRTMASPALSVRKLTQDMVNIPENLEKNYQGIATSSPVERELWKYEGDWNTAKNARADAFKTYRERVAGEGNADPLSRRDFNEQVSFAMRRGDNHDIPEVAQAAKDTRRIIFDPLKERAQKLGIISHDPNIHADSYLMRQYNVNAIRENMGDWMQRLTKGFMDQGVEQSEAMSIAHQVSRNVQGSERGTMDWKAMDGVVPMSGRGKERTLNLPDTLLEPYLNNDIDHLSHSYLRSLAPEVEMTERFGSRDMKDQFQDISDEYARLKQKALQQGDNGKAADLDKQQTRDIRDLSAMRDRLYGIYGQPKDPAAFAVRAGRMLRSVNALRLLGAATLAHFPDLANMTMKFGLPQSFAAVAKMLTSSEAMKLTRSEAQRMGAALDMSMNVTASLLGDYASHSQFAEQRVMNRATRAFTIATGETPLITAIQATTSTLSQHEIISVARKVAAGKNVSNNVLARYASGGLDKDMLTRIAGQYEASGRKVNGLHFGMSDTWKDQNTAAAFESAVLRDAHSVTLRPGAGDTPLLMSTELGKTLLQFKSFGFAASRTVVNPLLQGLAHGDPRAAQAILALVTMGTASYVAKQTAAGQPIETDPARLAMEVADKSNLMGWTSELAFPLLWQFGEKNLSRWGDRDPVETLLGPSAGLVAAAYERHFPSRMFGDQETANDTFRRSDLHFLRRLAPGQNLWFLRRAVNSTEDYVGDAFNLPGTSNKERELAMNQ